MSYCECPYEGWTYLARYAQAMQLHAHGLLCATCGKLTNPFWTWHPGDPLPNALPQGCEYRGDEAWLAEFWLDWSCCDRRWPLAGNEGVYEAPDVYLSGGSPAGCDPVIIDAASSDELDDMIRAQGGDPDEYVRVSREAIDRAIEDAKKEAPAEPEPKAVESATSYDDAEATPPRPADVFNALAECGIHYVTRTNGWRVGKRAFKRDQLASAIRYRIEVDNAPEDDEVTP